MGAMMMMMKLRRLECTAWLLGSVLPLGCATPCQDDGLLQDECPSAPPEASSVTDGASTDTNADTEADGPGSVDGDDRDAASGGDGPNDSADTTAGMASADDGFDDLDDLDDSDGSAGSDDGGGGPWCLDVDGDGFGDPAACSDHPGPGTVDNADDCNDADAGTFPGSAELEPDPTACTTDTDGDGWGDATPADGAVAGADCWDDEPDLNPSVVQVGTVDNGPLDDVAATVDELDATLSVIAPIDTPLLGWSTTAAALRHNGVVIAMDEVSGQLQHIDYQMVCAGTGDAGEAVAMGPDLSNLSLCGLSFDADDRLWAIDAQTNTVIELDPDVGVPLASAPLTFEGAPLELGDCDLTWDCHEERLLLAHASAGHVLALDPVSGAAELVAEYDPDLGAAGIAYEPLTRVVFVSSGIQLNLVPLDGAAASEIGTFNYDGATVADVANLSPLPICE
jgi:hypothetical protein